MRTHGPLRAARDAARQEDPRISRVVRRPGNIHSWVTWQLKDPLVDGMEFEDC